MIPDLRDYRESRDWRAWRDPPGFFPGVCCGASCTYSCDTGSTGSDSGSKCTTCGTQVILDDFSSTIDSAWISAGGTCSGAGVHPTLGAHTSGGQLVFGGGAGILRPFSRPALSGFCVEAKVTIVTQASPQTYGIVIAGGPYMFARPSFSNYGRQSCTDVSGAQIGCVTVPSFTTFGPVPANGDVISIIIRDAGGGDNGDGSVDCTICYKVNGTSYLVTDAVTCCFPSTMYAGIINLISTTAVFDDFEVRTN